MMNEEIIHIYCGKRNGEYWMPAERNVERIRDMLEKARQAERKRIISEILQAHPKDVIDYVRKRRPEALPKTGQVGNFVSLVQSYFVERVREFKPKGGRTANSFTGISEKYEESASDEGGEE